MFCVYGANNSECVCVCVCVCVCMSVLSLMVTNNEFILVAIDQAIWSHGVRRNCILVKLVAFELVWGAEFKCKNWLTN